MPLTISDTRFDCSMQVLSDPIQVLGQGLHISKSRLHDNCILLLGRHKVINQASSD